MSRPIHFEIMAEDPARAKTFYETVFGWTFQKWEGGPMEYWLITTGPDSEPGINGGMYKRPADKPATGYKAYVCTMGSKNLDADGCRYGKGESSRRTSHHAKKPDSRNRLVLSMPGY